MRTLLLVAAIGSMALLAACGTNPSDRTGGGALAGAATGAGVGALAGPPGMVVGGAIGAGAGAVTGAVDQPEPAQSGQTGLRQPAGPRADPERAGVAERKLTVAVAGRQAAPAT